MSYILDALKKSEQARGELPKISSVHEHCESRYLFRHSSLGIVLLAVSLAVAIYPRPEQKLVTHPLQIPLPNRMKVLPFRKIAKAPAPPAKPAKQAAAPASPPPKDKVYDYSELPAKLRQEISRPPVSGYAGLPGDPSKRMVAIGDRLLAAKDEVSPGLVLDEISPDGAIFSYKGYRFR